MPAPLSSTYGPDLTGLIQIVRDLASKVDSIEDRLLTRHRLDDSRSQLGAYRRLLVRL